MTNGNYPPRFVTPPSHDTELVALSRSLEQLRQVGSSPDAAVQITTREGLITVTSKKEANKIGRAILKEWGGLFPHLKASTKPRSRRSTTE